MEKNRRGLAALGAAVAMGSAVAMGAAMAGCGGTPIAQITARGLELRRDHYRVRARPDGTLADGAWIIDNFRLVGGRPRELLRTAGRMRRVAVDYDGDGRTDRATDEPITDLTLVHARDGSTMWTQTAPMDRVLARRDLEVIAHDYVDRVGSGSYVDVDWGARAVRERRVASVIREEGPVVVDGVPGYRVTFGIVSLDQRELDPSHEGDVVTVVILRPRAVWTESTRYSVAEGGVPMLVTIGLAARAEHHAAHVADFDELLGRVVFHESH